MATHPSSPPRLTPITARDHVSQVGERPNRNLTASDIMTAAEVGELLMVAPTTVYEWARSGAIPSLRRGRVVRFRRWEVEAWIAGDR